MVEHLPVDCRNVTSNVDMVVVDFMAFIRKLPQKIVSSLENYGNLARTLMNLIVNHAVGSSAKRIDIIFDVYRKNSIKDDERASRSSSQGITVSIKKDIQKLPVDMSLFWSSMENKIQIQYYFMNWVVKNCEIDKEVYFGGIPDGSHCIKLVCGITLECPELSSVQEEADDRLMFHINHGCKSGVRSVLVLSPDADVLTCLLYHLQKTWTLDELYLKLGRGKTVPLHMLVQKLEHDIVANLPAIHALSGCDTTSKVGSKLACLKKSLIT